MSNIKTNIWRIYIYRFLSDFWLMAPILVPFYKSNGLNATEVFVIQAIYSASVLAFEIPSGYLSDAIGRRTTLIIGSILLPVGLGVYAFSYGFWGFAFAEIILGMAGSLKSGTDSALIYDSLIQIRQESEYTRLEGKAEFYHHLGHATSSVLGGLLALVALRLPFYVNIFSGLLLIPLALSLIEPEREKPKDKNPFAGMIRIIGYSLAHKQIRALALYFSLLVSSSIIGVWSYYLYYEKLGLGLGYYGVLFAITGLCTAYGASRAHSIEKAFGRVGALLFLLLMSLIFIILGLGKSPFLIALIFINTFIGGTSAPLFVSYINESVDTDIRATVLSVTKMGASLAVVILSPIFGKLVDIYSLSCAHISLGVFFLAIGLLSMFLLRRNKVI